MVIPIRQKKKTPLCLHKVSKRVDLTTTTRRRRTSGMEARRRKEKGRRGRRRRRRGRGSSNLEGAKPIVSQPWLVGSFLVFIPCESLVQTLFSFLQRCYRLGQWWPPKIYHWNPGPPAVCQNPVLHTPKPPIRHYLHPNTLSRDSHTLSKNLPCLLLPASLHHFFSFAFLI